MGRPDQQSIYLDDENRIGLDKLAKKCAHQSRNALINAAVLFDLQYAMRRLDGNLMPYTLENRPKLPRTEPTADIEAIRRVVEQVLDEREKTKKRMAHPS